VVLARGADAGFNEPALAAYARRAGANPDPATADLDLIRVINGDFYTQFVRACSALVRERGKRIEHFIQPLMDRLADNRINNVPEAFHFDYRQWLREGLLDGLCIRPLWSGADNMRFGDMTGALARLFDVTMVYANQNGPLNRAAADNDVPEHIGDELRHARDSELFDGFILYEAAGVMGIGEDGRMHTSTNLERCLEENWEYNGLLQEPSQAHVRASVLRAVLQAGRLAVPGSADSVHAVARYTNSNV
jgi:hypothetical protein